MDIAKLFYRQQKLFLKQGRSAAKDRVAKLKDLKEKILDHTDDICQAITEDFSKHSLESKVTEIYPVVSEIDNIVKHLASWMKPKKVGASLAIKGTTNRIYYDPKGNVLVISPWNYPFNLSMIPLITAYAAGNTVILKPSPQTPATNQIIGKIVCDIFDEDEIALVYGDKEVVEELLELPFNHIFFTGSTAVGKIIMEKAAKHLASVTLELGGKSPAIVTEHADIDKIAKKIVWGKFVNSGQTCIAPDYILVHESCRDELIDKLIENIEKFYGVYKDQKKSKSFARIINHMQHARLQGILERSMTEGATLAYGGDLGEDRYISPTIMTEVTREHTIMQEEIFGPILPILEYANLDKMLEELAQEESPLALYIFSEDREEIKCILKRTQSGGVSINDTLLHVANHHLPFGGKNHSGIGSYHGHHGFIACSHERSICERKMELGLEYFYPPYSEKKERRFGSFLAKSCRKFISFKL